MEDPNHKRQKNTTTVVISPLDPSAQEAEEVVAVVVSAFSGLQKRSGFPRI